MLVHVAIGVLLYMHTRKKIRADGAKYILWKAPYHVPSIHLCVAVPQDRRTLYATGVAWVFTRHDTVPEV